MPTISRQDVDKLATLVDWLQGVVSSLRGLRVELSPEAAARLSDRVARNVCLQCQSPLETEEKVTRGLCNTCYTKSAQRVARNKTTWEQIIVEGYILAESKKGGRKSKVDDPVGKILLARTADEMDAAAAKIRDRNRDTKSKKR